MKPLQGKLTYANVVATIAVFIALGGSAFAAAQLKKNSVGSKQLKKDSVTGAKVKNGALSAADIGGPVNEALSAGTATNAGRSTSSANADQLGGSPPASFRDRCPAATQIAAGNLCVYSKVNTIDGFGWDEQMEDCAALGLRLPSPGEAMLIGSGQTESFFTDDLFEKGTTRYFAYFDHSEKIVKTVPEGGGLELTVCVATPTDL